MRQKAARSKASGAIVEYMEAIAGVRPKPHGAIDFYSFGGGSHTAGFTKSAYIFIDTHFFGIPLWRHEVQI